MSGNDFLLSDARKLLAEAQANPVVRRYREKLPLGDIWKKNAAMKAAALGATSSANALADLQTRLFVHESDARKAELAVRWNLDQPFMRAYTPPEASDYAPEDSVVRVGAKKYWHDDFRHFGTLQRIMKALAGERLTRVVELGAGAGNLARLFRLFFAKTQYVIVDLPDTLVFSMMFLRANFPEASWLFITEDTKAIDLPGYDFIFCPAGLEHVFHGVRFDAFINTASLGEMRTDAVRHWFDFFQTQTECRSVFSVNRFLNTIEPTSHEWRMTENASALMFDDRWEIIDWELEPDFLRCPWNNRHARQALIFGKRAAPQMADGATIADALLGSWNNAHHAMMVQDPPLGADFKRSGILFPLWDAWRLRYPGAQTALLDYMNYLAQGKTFEEAAQLRRYGDPRVTKASAAA